MLSMRRLPALFGDSHLAPDVSIGFLCRYSLSQRRLQSQMKGFLARCLRISLFYGFLSFCICAPVAPFSLLTPTIHDFLRFGILYCMAGAALRSCSAISARLQCKETLNCFLAGRGFDHPESWRAGAGNPNGDEHSRD
jgi:hypothetical protein